MVNIYILELEQGKYYVGKTDHTFQRFNQHNTGSGAKWTQKYPVVDLYDFHRNMRNHDENRITLQMMRKFGAENVRGGSWTKVDMTPSHLRNLNIKAKKGRYDKSMPKRRECNRCGRHSHTDRNCYARYHANGKSLARKESLSQEDYVSFVEDFKERRTKAAMQDTADMEIVQKELAYVECMNEKDDDSKLEMLELLSEEEDEDNTDIFEEIFGPITQTLREFQAIAGEIKKTKKKAVKFGKKISKNLKKNLGLK